MYFWLSYCDENQIERKSSLIYNASARHDQHECDTSHTSETRVKNFDFDSGTSKNIFLNPYIYYMASERLQEEEQFL